LKVGPDWLIVVLIAVFASPASFSAACATG